MSDPQDIIVKVQVPIFTNGPGEILVYNEDRSFEEMLSIGKEERKFIKVCMRGRDKAFFYAKLYHKKHGWALTDREAPWQEW